MYFFTENSMQQEHILLAREFPPKIMCDSYNRAQFWRIGELTITDYFKAHREYIKKGYPQWLIDMLKILTSTNKSKNL